MNNSLGQILYHSSRFFSVSIRRETRASRWRLSDLKPAISSLGLKFVSDFCWKRSDVGFGRSLSGGFASMAFSGGNGGSGKSDSYSGEGGDDEDDHGSNLVGSWSLAEDILKHAVQLILGKLFRSIVIWYASPLAIETGEQFLHVKQVMMLSAENASKPPDNVECCICLSTYEGRSTWSSLPCNHWFHSSCINCWVQINPICPICRLGAYGTT